MFYNPKQPTKLNIECLSSFKGVTRRQECLYRDPLIGVFEDFAHHPSSLKKTLERSKIAIIIHGSSYVLSQEAIQQEVLFFKMNLQML